MPATKPSVAIIGTGIRTFSMNSLELPDTETALLEGAPQLFPQRSGSPAA